MEDWLHLERGCSHNLQPDRVPSHGLLHPLASVRIHSRLKAAPVARRLHPPVGCALSIRRRARETKDKLFEKWPLLPSRAASLSNQAQPNHNRSTSIVSRYDACIRTNLEFTAVKSSCAGNRLWKSLWIVHAFITIAGLRRVVNFRPPSAQFGRQVVVGSGPILLYGANWPVFSTDLPQFNANRSGFRGCGQALIGLRSPMSVWCIDPCR